MLKIDLHPDDRKLRQFAWIALAGFSLAALVVWLRFHNGTAASILAGFAVLVPLLSLIHPRLVRPVYIGLSLIAYPIGFVISTVILVLLFFGLFMPISLFFKLIGRDALMRKWEPNASSYWVDRGPERDASSYYRQF